MLSTLAVLVGMSTPARYNRPYVWHGAIQRCTTLYRPVPTILYVSTRYSPVVHGVRNLMACTPPSVKNARYSVLHVSGSVSPGGWW